MLEFIIITIAVIGFLIGSYHDLFRDCEVPDYLTGSLILIGVAINLLLIINAHDWTKLITLSALVPGAFGLGYAMYKAKQWAGGDVKMLTATAALFPSITFFSSFMLNLVLAGVLYGILYSLIVGIKDRKRMIEQVKLEAKKWKAALIASAVMIPMLSLTMPGAMNWAVLLLLGILIVISLLLSAVEKTSFIKKLETRRLLEGDWIAESIEKLNIKKYQQLTKKNIAELKNNKINHVLVKWGVPFIPSFLAALILTLVLQNNGINFYLGLLARII